MEKKMTVIIVFMAFALGPFCLNPTWETAIPFVAAAAVFALLSWIDRERTSELDAMKQQIQGMNDRLTNVMAHLGWQ